MSWIQENKFVAGLIGVTVVIGGGIIYFGSSQGSAFNAKMQEYESLKGQYASLEKATPYPNKENLNERKQGIAKYDEEIMAVHSALVAFSPDAEAKMTPKEFSDARVKVTADLNQAFKDTEVELPDVPIEFGFEKYATSLPKPAATTKLSYQLGATQWLLTKLAEAKPAALLNVNRTVLPIEDGKEAAKPAPPKEGKKKKSKKGGRKSAKKGASKPTEAPPYELMPMELTFTANEAGVRQFLKQMVNSEKYFFSIRALRISNEKQVGPTQRDANFPTTTPAAEGNPLGGGFDGFLSGVDDGGDPEDADAAAEEENLEELAAKVSEVILKKVLGDEKLHVHIAFDVVLLKPMATAPADAKDADSK